VCTNIFNILYLIWFYRNGNTKLQAPSPYEQTDALLSLAQVNAFVTRTYVMSLASKDYYFDYKHISLIPEGVAVPSHWKPIPATWPRLYANEDLFKVFDQALNIANSLNIKYEPHTTYLKKIFMLI
jgi:hypothetical protein